MVSHTTHSAEHILGCVMAWGQVCPSRIQSGIACLQCFIAGLIYCDIANCCASSPRILVRGVSGLGTQFFICFDKNCLYLCALFLPVEDAWLWQKNAWQWQKAVLVSVSICMDIHKKSYFTGANRLLILFLFFYIRSCCRIFCLPAPSSGSKHLDFSLISKQQDLLKLGTTLQAVLQILERQSELWVVFETRLLKLIVS